MEDCIFCKIVKGEIPCHKIYEDNNVFVFLDANPLVSGHCLAIPRKHFENIFDIDKNVMAEIVETTRKLAKKMKNNLGVTGVDLVSASGRDADQSVFHFHLHIIPRRENDGLTMNDWWRSKMVKQSQEDINELIEKLK